MEETLISIKEKRLPEIISIEGKCGVGKSTWLKSRGIFTEETVDFKVDERTHDDSAGMIPFEEQMEFVTHKIEQFKNLLVDLETAEDDIYIDGSMLYNTAYGAAYYWWYILRNYTEEEGRRFIKGYLDVCYHLIDKDLPKGWQDRFTSVILIPEKDSDIRERILKRGRPSEVANIDNMLEINNFFMDFLIVVLDHYKVKYTYETVYNRVD